jgi:hypothetical protein
MTAETQKLDPEPAARKRTLRCPYCTGPMEVYAPAEHVQVEGISHPVTLQLAYHCLQCRAVWGIVFVRREAGP